MIDKSSQIDCVCGKDNARLEHVYRDGCRYDRVICLECIRRGKWELGGRNGENLGYLVDKWLAWVEGEKCKETEPRMDANGRKSERQG